MLNPWPGVAGGIQLGLLMTMRLPGISARLLSETRWRVIEAANGSDGLRRAQQQHPQVIPLDLFLPDRTGFEVMDWLRSNPVPCGTTIVINSANHPEQYARRRLAAVDNLSALERVWSIKSFREFVIGLTSFVKQQEIAGLFTATSAELLGGTSVTETHISTITDSIILLRYVEVFGEMRRGITVLKMRGSMHDKDSREFTIDGKGLHIGRPFRGISGILSGHFVHATSDEAQRISEMFRDDAQSGRS